MKLSDSTPKAPTNDVPAGYQRKDVEARLREAISAEQQGIPLDPAARRNFIVALLRLAAEYAIDALDLSPHTLAGWAMRALIDIHRERAKALAHEAPLSAFHGELPQA